MKTLVAFLEEPSAVAMLKELLPPLLPSDFELKCIHFEGKQDLERNLERKLRGWKRPDSFFLVMRDRDSENCLAVKKRLVSICRRAGHPETIVRIACGELESFYLGDLDAVAHVYGKKMPSAKASKFRDPDSLNNAADELKRITGNAYQKVSGSRAIAARLRTDGSNHSHSFNVLVDGIRRLVCGSRSANLRASALKMSKGRNSQ